MLTLLAYVVLGILAVGIIVWGIKRAPWIEENYKQAAIIVIGVIGGLWVLYQVYLMIQHGHLPR